MKKLDEVLQIMGARIDRSELEGYIAHEWLRPASSQEGWDFEEIDIARLQLVCHLMQDIKVNDEGVDVVLSLLDQLYGLRAHMKKLANAVAQQSPQVRTEIMMLIQQRTETK